jgi:BirA family biotin operon repressor/biotin-[acetyl-CoA-carboxylase] ligase
MTIKKIHTYSSLPSTNKKAYQLAAKGAFAGEVVRAGSQSAGRGRLGKTWQSPVGKGLYFSLIVRPDLAVEDYPKITMTTGLAVAKVLERLCERDIFLKWPNDIYMSGRKCCGILAEASIIAESSADRFVVVGIGLNVLTEKKDFPEIIRENATSLLIETDILFDMDELLTALCDETIAHIAILERQGFAYILEQWKTRDILQGRWLEWVTNSGEVIVGRSEGPDDNGQLLVRDGKGVLHEVLSGDITIADDK